MLEETSKAAKAAELEETTVVKHAVKVLEETSKAAKVAELEETTVVKHAVKVLEETPKVLNTAEQEEYHAWPPATEEHCAGPPATGGASCRAPRHWRSRAAPRASPAMPHRVEEKAASPWPAGTWEGRRR